ncbi:hypothetical protein A2U01_0006699 [Trifolium medium]|uniref:Uncharacterized protein n=1 Tax=Trifolium medium TaxID=97028 RepID=A0A392MEA5_9FABA|nr:hypothetical protein [Trifolium medium]
MINNFNTENVWWLNRVLLCQRLRNFKKTRSLTEYSCVRDLGTSKRRGPYIPAEEGRYMPSHYESCCVIFGEVLLKLYVCPKDLGSLRVVNDRRKMKKMVIDHEI